MTELGGSNAASLQMNCWPRQSHDVEVEGMLPVGLWPLERQTQCVKEILFSFTFQIKEQIIRLTETSWSGDGLVCLISFSSLTDGQNLDMIFSPWV